MLFNCVVIVDRFSPGTTFQNIWLNNLRCLGTEDSLNSCSHSGVGNHDCTHGQDVGLKCGGGEDGIYAHGCMLIDVPLLIIIVHSFSYCNRG